MWTNSHSTSNSSNLTPLALLPTKSSSTPNSPFFTLCFVVWVIALRGLWKKWLPSLKPCQTRSLGWSLHLHMQPSISLLEPLTFKVSTTPNLPLPHLPPQPLLPHQNLSALAALPTNALCVMSGTGGTSALKILNVKATIKAPDSLEPGLFFYTWLIDYHDAFAPLVSMPCSLTYWPSSSLLALLIPSCNLLLSSQPSLWITLALIFVVGFPLNKIFLGCHWVRWEVTQSVTKIIVPVWTFLPLAAHHLNHNLLLHTSAKVYLICFKSWTLYIAPPLQLYILLAITSFVPSQEAPNYVPFFTASVLTSYLFTHLSITLCPPSRHLQIPFAPTSPSTSIAPTSKTSTGRSSYLLSCNTGLLPNTVTLSRISTLLHSLGPPSDGISFQSSPTISCCASSSHALHQLTHSSYMLMIIWASRWNLLLMLMLVLLWYETCSPPMVSSSILLAQTKPQTSLLLLLILLVRTLHLVLTPLYPIIPTPHILPSSMLWLLQLCHFAQSTSVSSLEPSCGPQVTTNWPSPSFMRYTVSLYFLTNKSAYVMELGMDFSRHSCSPTYRGLLVICQRALHITTVILLFVTLLLLMPLRLSSYPLITNLISSVGKYLLNLIHLNNWQSYMLWFALLFGAPYIFSNFASSQTPLLLYLVHSISTLVLLSLYVHYFFSELPLSLLLPNIPLTSCGCLLPTTQQTPLHVQTSSPTTPLHSTTAITLLPSASFIAQLLLTLILTELALLSVAKGTVYNYGINLNLYLQWCTQNSTNPLHQNSINDFIMFCYTSGKSYSKANSTYSAYLFFCKLNGLTPNTPPLTRLALRGYKRSYINSKPVLWVKFDEIKAILALWSPLQAHFFTCLILSFFTLVRPHELLAITWKDVDWQHRHVQLPISKNDPFSRGTFVHLLPTAYNALLNIRPQNPNPDQPVLLINYNQLNPWLSSKCKAARVTDYNWYALKHGGATYFALIGWTLSRIQQHGRWKSPESARVYIHAPVRT